MKILGLAAMACVLFGCPGGTPATDGGGGGSGGGTGGGAGGGDAGPVNLLPDDFQAAGSTVLIAADGGGVVVGQVSRPDSGTSIDLLVARFGGNLVRDPAFGTDGVAVADFDGGSLGGLISLDNDFGSSAAFDGDKIITVGSARGEAAGGYDWALVRFTASGQLDPTFGTGGTVLKPYGMQNAGHLNNVAVIGGKYLVCGVVNGSAVLARYNADGTIDPAFTGAVTNFGTNELCGTLLIQGTKALAAGRDFTIARYTDVGAVDTTFGTAGAYTTSGSLGGAHLRADGKIWLVGTKVVSSGGTDTSYLKQVLLSADGVPDTGFGTGGILETPLNLSQVRGAAMQGAKLVLYIPSVPARLIRINADGSIDASFGTSGTIPVPFTLPLFDAPFDAHRHLTITGNTAWVTDLNLVGTRTRLGLFTTPLP